MTTAITLLAKKMTREKRLPFDVSPDPFYSASNMAALNESIEDDLIEVYQCKGRYDD